MNDRLKTMRVFLLKGRQMAQEYMNEKLNSMESESGTFFVDDHGNVQRFEPSEDNPIMDEVTDYVNNYIHRTEKTIRTLIVPEVVKGFVSAFMRGVRVIERFELPEGLLSIGNNSFDFEEGVNCVFANCILPTVVIPENVRVIGSYAFGSSHIDVLQLPASLRSPYGRQFKDSSIGTLRLPHEWEDLVSLDNGCLRIKDVLCTEDYGYLRWPSTYVEKLEFY